MNKILMGGIIITATTTLTSIANTDKVDAVSLYAKENLNIRSGPSTSYNRIGSLQKGSSVTLIDSSNGWYKIKYGNGYGWVIGQYMTTNKVITSNNNNNNKTAYVTANLNVRSGHSTAYPKIGSLQKGSSVTLIDSSNGWYKIKYGNGYGWITSQYVTSGNMTINNTNNKIKTAYVTANLNVRSGHSTAYPKIGLIRQGTKIQIVDSSNGWCKIKYGNGYGWITSQYATSGNLTINNTNNITQGNVLKNLIVINQKYHTLKLYEKGKQVYVTSCAVGSENTPTPNGKFSIVNKIKNRPYYKGNIAGGDPRNPLGKYWMGLSIGGGQTYGIHGNNNESSIGKSVSGGCIRLHNSDIEYLFSIVPENTTVIITDKETNKTACLQYGIMIY